MNEVYALVIGLVVAPTVIGFLKKQDWSDSAKIALTLVVCFALSFIENLFLGNLIGAKGFNFEALRVMIVTDFSIMATSAMVAYKTYFSLTTIGKGRV